MNGTISYCVRVILFDKDSRVLEKGLVPCVSYNDARHLESMLSAERLIGDVRRTSEILMRGYTWVGTVLIPVETVQQLAHQLKMDNVEGTSTERPHDFKLSAPAKPKLSMSERIKLGRERAEAIRPTGEDE